MEPNVPYNRMPPEVEVHQGVAQPTIVMAPPSQQRYNTYDRCGNIGLGITQLVCGLILIVLTCILLGVESPLAPIADGIWCGIIIVLSGSFQITAGKTQTKCWIVTSMVFSILAAVFVMPVLIVASIDIPVTMSQDYNDDYHYYYDYGDPVAIYTLNGLRIVIALAEGIAAIVASGMACRPLCCTTTQVQYVGTNEHGQQVIIMTNSAVTAQPVVAVPMIQQGYTASGLTQAGAPPMYTAAPVAQMAAPQPQPMPTLNVQQPKEQPN